MGEALRISGRAFAEGWGVEGREVFAPIAERVVAAGASYLVVLHPDFDYSKPARHSYSVLVAFGRRHVTMSLVTAFAKEDPERSAKVAMDLAKKRLERFSDG